MQLARRPPLVSQALSATAETLRTLWSKRIRSSQAPRPSGSHVGVVRVVDVEDPEDQLLDVETALALAATVVTQPPAMSQRLQESCTPSVTTSQSFSILTPGTGVGVGVGGIGVSVAVGVKVVSSPEAA